MTNTELHKQLSKKTGLTRTEIKKVMNSFLEISLKTLKKEKSVTILGMCKIRIKKTKSKKARDWTSPLTGETMRLPAKRAGRVVKACALKKSKEVLG